MTARPTPWFVTAPPPPQFPGVPLGALACEQDPERWFDITQGGVFSPQVGRSCERCPVRAECLAWAVEAAPEFGVWAGYTAKELDRWCAGRPMGVRSVQRGADDPGDVLGAAGIELDALLAARAGADGLVAA